MKPLKLTVEGINSFTDACTVDFERLSQDGIFCICGPTGSGKTTILDSIILALYGENKNRGNLADYINTKCGKGKITFDFDICGERYTLYREIRRKADGKSESVAKLTKSASGEVIADRVDTVTEEVKKIVKLDKDEFTKVVILEQGRFAQFMQMGGKDRSKTVSKLFALEKYEKLKEVFAAAKNKYEKLMSEADRVLKEFNEFTEEKYSDKLKESKRLNKELAERKIKAEQSEKKVKAGENLMAFAEKKKAARAAADNAQAELETLNVLKENQNLRAEYLEKQKNLLEELKVKDGAARVTLNKIEECLRDEEIKNIKIKERDALREKYVIANCKIKEINDETLKQNAEKGNNEAIAASIMRDITVLGYDITELTEAAFAALKAIAESDEARLSDAENKLKAAEKKFTECSELKKRLIIGKIENDKAVKQYGNQAESACKEYEQARVESEAAAVRLSLSAGDACPVCGSEYHGYRADEYTDENIILTLKEKYDRANKAYEKAVAQSNEIAVSDTINNDAMKNAESAVNEYKAMLASKSAANAKKSAELAVAGAQAAKKRDAADRKLAELAGNLGMEKANAQKISEDGKRIAGDITELERKIAERLGGKAIETAKSDAEKAVREYAEAQKKYDGEFAALQKEEKDFAARESAAKTKLEENLKTIAELPDADFDEQAFYKDRELLESVREEIASLGAEIGGLETEIRLIREKLERKKELAAQKSRLRVKLDAISELNACTAGDNKLLSYVAEEYVQSFTVAASETLNKLTGGKYTLKYDNGDFYVEDFFSDNARRKVKTLSGGETFLASVSIAMAISREIAATQNYEFFFLDEGFGTLDERAIETVTDALISLSKETTVGVITHRGELAERIGARLNVIPACEDRGSDAVVSV